MNELAGSADFWKKYCSPVNANHCMVLRHNRNVANWLLNYNYYICICPSIYAHNSVRYKFIIHLCAILKSNNVTVLLLYVKALSCVIINSF